MKKILRDAKILGYYNFKSMEKRSQKEISKSFSYDTAVIYHSLDYHGNPQEESGIIASNKKDFKEKGGLVYAPGAKKGILLHSNSTFFEPNWYNVERYMDVNKRVQSDKKFVIRDEKGSPIKIKKTRSYSKTHITKKALDSHISKIKDRNGKYKVIGMTIEYSF